MNASRLFKSGTALRKCGKYLQNSSSSHFCSRALISTKFTLNGVVSCQFRSFSSTENSFLAPVESNGNQDDDNTTIRPKLRVKHVLANIQRKNFTLPENSTIADGINALVKERLSSLLTLDDQGNISGIFTSADILKFVNDHHLVTQGGLRNHNDPLLSTRIFEIMTKKEKLVYCSPNDTVKRCREIMFQCSIENMPIIENGLVMGIITLKHLADSSFSIAETGGKKGFIHNVTGRKGLPQGTRVSLNTAVGEANGKHTLLTQLDIEMASYALPHPFKRPEGVAMSRRLYGADELSTDMSVCEDAHFIMRVKDPMAMKLTIPDPSSPTTMLNSVIVAPDTDTPNSAPAALYTPSQVSKKENPSQVYMCVADGVGNWRQYGVDPRDYSHKLVENARKVIESDVLHRELIGDSPFDRGLDPIHPLDVIVDAWNMTTIDEINGSSTICVATLDKKLNQLSYSNIGDCGLIVIRHIDSETAGYMRERQRPRHLRKNDLRVAYLSQQQLKSFNLPYQLGYIDPKIQSGTFETPTDADTASIPIMPGDIIILATDGLFDNLDLDEIVDEVSNWEHAHFPTPMPGTAGEGVNLIGATTPSGSGAGSADWKIKRKLPFDDGSQIMQNLAERLVLKARELSLDKQRDSPFAILAKENDIMWGGGMPDDTTVVVGRVVQV